MSTATKTITETDILRTIGKLFAEQFCWPSPSDITDELGPVHGLASKLAAMELRGLVEITSGNSIQRIELRMPAQEQDWAGDYQNVKSLGRWLVSELAFDSEQLQGYYDKPWNWNDEYAAFLACNLEVTL